jgi:hypothetical protein
MKIQKKLLLELMREEFESFIDEDATGDITTGEEERDYAAKADETVDVNQLRKVIRREIAKVFFDLFAKRGIWI